jgi:hypothetical protein
VFSSLVSQFLFLFILCIDFKVQLKNLFMQPFGVSFFIL